MDDDQDSELISRLLLDDIEELQSKQKGKQAAGTQTDLEVALSHQREQILTLQTATRDRTFALSMITAITTDQNLLAAIENDERLAEQDRRYAISLRDGRSVTQGVPSSLAIGGAVSVPSNDGAVSSAMGDLMNRFTLNDKLNNGEGSSRYIPSSRSRIKSPGIECSSCFEKCDAILFAGPCGHKFCRDCTRQMFLGAIKDEELHPPRCCRNLVPPETASRVLNQKELQQFSERKIEYSAKNRIYCADPTCSKFIPLLAIKNEHGTCPECQQQTHVPCRSLAHPGVDCPLDEELQTVLTVAKKEKWKRCPNCRTMVELYHGCNHITCRLVNLLPCPDTHIDEKLILLKMRRSVLLRLRECLEDMHVPPLG